MISERREFMATPLGAMKIELGLETNSFNNGLTSSKGAVSYFKREANAAAIEKENVKLIDLMMKCLVKSSLFVQVSARSKILSKL
jgi:hypothetical protein